VELHGVEDLKKFIDLIFRQHNIGQWWGGLRSTISNTTMYLTLFNTALLVPMAYITWVNPWFTGLGINLTFIVFLVVVILSSIVVLLIEFKFLTPSSFDFWNEQWWLHRNLLRERLDIRDKEINEQYERLYKQIDSIKAELKELRVALLKKNRNE
jgi:hypothetical protein